MKNFITNSRATNINWRLINLSFIFLVLIGLNVQTPIQAQEIQYTRPSWWFGVAGGANFNFYKGSTQYLNTDFSPPIAFHDGDGVGLFIAPLLEYHSSHTSWGFMLQASYDSRRGNYEQIITSCNCPVDLYTKLVYIAVEPSIRLAPFKTNFYLYGGPRFAFNQEKSYTYKLGTNPDYTNQATNPDINGELSDVRKNLISMQIGMGYDVQLSSQKHKTQYVLSPFVSFHPYYGQDPRTIETWNITTIRAGIAFKLGNGRNIKAVQELGSTVMDNDVDFTIDLPQYITVEKRVREVFPLRNYIFFNLESTEIPERYVLLTQDQVKNFKEEQVALFTPKNMSGRSDRQMIVYYNILNILGDRMNKYNTTNIKLVGSSAKGSENGIVMAKNVQKYLVDVFKINSDRIVVEGRTRPEIPSGQLGGTLELELLREGDNRVSIESNSSELLMEFQSGDAPLKTIEIITVEQDLHKNDITINVEGATKTYTSWIIEMKDINGKVFYFGPYTKDQMIISRNTVLENLKEGKMEVVLVGQTISGKTVKKQNTIYVTPYVAPQIQESIRFSVIFEFNSSTSIDIYKTYLTEIVTPKIPFGATVRIKGFTDIIGDDTYNQQLSIERAVKVKNIIEMSLTQSNRTDVSFEINGFGEDLIYAPFDNTYPEGRFYNRTVVIDIIQK